MSRHQLTSGQERPRRAGNSTRAQERQLLLWIYRAGEHAFTTSYTNRNVDVVGSEMTAYASRATAIRLRVAIPSRIETRGGSGHGSTETSMIGCLGHGCVKAFDIEVRWDICMSELSASMPLRLRRYPGARKAVRCNDDCLDKPT